MAHPRLPAEAQSLALTPDLRSGLKAITVLAFVSFISSSILFLYLSYKLVWHLNYKRRSERHSSLHASSDSQQRSLQRRVDFALGIDGIFTTESNTASEDGAAKDPKFRNHTTTTTTTKLAHPDPGRQPPNQFLILVFNLLLADMHQGAAFFLNVQWLRHDMVLVGTPACFAQGLFVSTGDLASSCFITTIAVHTYLSVVRRRLMPQKLLYFIIVSIWIFVYAISTIPIGATTNGAHYGGFFVRAGAWCWMNRSYETLRLVTHYLFIFMALATTSGLYIAIFINLRRQTRPNASTDLTGTTDPAAVAQLQLSRNPAFLIYPVIYVMCTLPLAVGRLTSMVGGEPPLGYMCFAGAMIASNGMFDCLLFGTTRNVIVFASKHEVDHQATGLNTFAFMQAARARRYGNMVWIEGGGDSAATDGDVKTEGRSWPWQRLGGEGGPDRSADGPRPRSHRRTGSRSVSQESLRRTAAIQMDTVTTVVVEVDPDKDLDRRYPDPSASVSPSVESTERRWRAL